LKRHTYATSARRKGECAGWKRTSFGIKTVSGADCLRWLRTPSHMIYLQLHFDLGNVCECVCVCWKVKWRKKLRKFPVNSCSFLRLISIPPASTCLRRVGEVLGPASCVLVVLANCQPDGKKAGLIGTLSLQLLAERTCSESLNKHDQQCESGGISQTEW